MTLYLIEVQHHDRGWAWSIGLPETEVVTGGWEGMTAVPFGSDRVEIDGKPFRRLQRGWTRSERRAWAKACRAAERDHASRKDDGSWRKRQWKWYQPTGSSRW
jgi:hypothetical protein